MFEDKKLDEPFDEVTEMAIEFVKKAREKLTKGGISDERQGYLILNSTRYAMFHNGIKDAVPPKGG